jgi:hypothetical protein
VVPPNRAGASAYGGKADSLEEAKAAFKQRYPGEREERGRRTFRMASAELSPIAGVPQIDPVQSGDRCSGAGVVVPFGVENHHQP